MKHPVLHLQGYGLAFGKRVVLTDCNLDLPQTGIDVLMGPVKAGKSSLLNSLAGRLESVRNYRRWGECTLRGRPLQGEWRPRLVAQHVSSRARTVLDVLREQAFLFERRGSPEDDRQSAGKTPSAGVREPERRSGTQWQTWAKDYLECFFTSDLVPLLDEPLINLPLVQQRRIRIVAKVVANPAMLMIDEPTYGLTSREATELLDWLKLLGKPVKLLVTLHNQQQARYLANTIGLLGGGRILAHQTAEQFFSHPANEWVEQFIRSGSLSLPSPDALPDDLDPEVSVPSPLPAAAVAAVQEAAKEDEAASANSPLGEPFETHVDVVPPSPEVATPGMVDVGEAPIPTRRPVSLPPTLAQGVELAASVGQVILSGRQGPSGFRWIVPGMLAGCPKPGVVAPIDYDLELLTKAGITHLITLTEKDLDLQALQRHGLGNTHLPIFDREAPSTGQMQLLLVRMQRLIQAGEVLAVHCHAGLGRTGLVLAAWLIRDGGLSAATAMDRLRRIDPAYVQTEVQEKFLHRFEEDLVRRLS
ncbi:dual specificity protein phosphatase family protein [Rhodoferax sp.]|uniref:phosphatase domain-containing putative toxin n=1 Tax=Rhodoferax sp. TaxID=50421 RepID=UPI0026222C28|nr:dual specificity protein phosphatase family protein [Rhodoferax sp.]MDD2925640.1 dual specificity protein phosphatase family protein [Rhodoferax sp.]